MRTLSMQQFYCLDMTEKALVPAVLPGVAEQQAGVPEVIKIEKNLNSMGFFSPSHKGLDTRRSKTVQVVREDRGRKIQATATIYPSPDHGLPTTADQDKYFAFQKIVTDLKKRLGHVANPIGFTTYQLLKILGMNPSGKNYEEIGLWLERMTLTGIRSQNLVYFAGQKTWAKDVFHVFERVVQVGQQLPDGRTADQNYVWMSEWQLENLNHNYVLPVDLNCYRKLRSNISKALVPLLQIWFYASQRRPVEKRYSELCQQLNIKQWEHLSKIRENFAPALIELKEHQFLGDWEISRTADKTDFKLILLAGERFSREFRLRLAGREPRDSGVQDPRFDGQVKMLTDRGVREDKARQLLFDVADDQPVEDQLEYCDHLIRSAPKGKFFNPAGFYVYMVQQNVQPPAGFETTRRRDLRVRQEQDQMARNGGRAEAETRRLAAEERYRAYQDEVVSRYMETSMDEGEVALRLKPLWKDLAQTCPSVEEWSEGERRALLVQCLKRRLAEEIPMMSMEEFLANSQLALF